MRIVAEANKYVTDQAPFKLKAEPSASGWARSCTSLAQAVSDCNTLISPFLPHSSNAVHAALGGEGVVAPMPRIEEVADLDDARRGALPGHHRRLHARRRRGSRGRSRPGTPVAKPVADLHQARPLGGRRGAGAAGR